MSFFRKAAPVAPPAPAYPVLPNDMPVAAEQVTFAGDVEIALKPDNTPEVRVGVQRGVEGATWFGRRVIDVLETGIYVPGNMYQSMENAYEKAVQLWGPPPYGVNLRNGVNVGAGNMWAVIRVPPGVHDMAAPVVKPFMQNYSLEGYGAGGEESAPGGPGAGGGMTQLVAPANQWGMIFGAALSTRGTTHPILGTNDITEVQQSCFAGPSLKNIHWVGHASGTSRGAVYMQRQKNFVLENVTASQFRTGYGFLFDGGDDTCEYGYMRRVYINSCKYSLRMHISDATMDHVVIVGNRIQNEATIAGSIGLWEYLGANRSNGLIIQGCDTLHLFDSDHPSHHNGIRYEDWQTCAVRIRRVVSNADHGLTMLVQSANNHMGGTDGAAFILESGVKNAYIQCRHTYAGNGPIVTNNSGNSSNVLDIVLNTP